MKDAFSGDKRRRYVFEHAIDPARRITALVAWSGDGWTVKINDDLVPDCCETIEEAFSVAEKEIVRRFPEHACQDCRPWQPEGEA